MKPFSSYIAFLKFLIFDIYFHAIYLPNINYTDLLIIFKMLAWPAFQSCFAFSLLLFHLLSQWILCRYNCWDADVIFSAIFAHLFAAAFTVGRRRPSEGNQAMVTFASALLLILQFLAYFPNPKLLKMITLPVFFLSLLGHSTPIITFLDTHQIISHHPWGY